MKKQALTMEEAEFHPLSPYACAKSVKALGHND
jgi:hypothetical protein